MAAETIRVDRPLPAAALLLGGLRSLVKRPPAVPLLPNVRLLRDEVAIDPQHLSAYCALCGFDRASGVPVTYPHLLAFPLHLRMMLRRDFPYPLPGLVHIANRIVQHRALRTGERPWVRAGFGPFRAHRRGQALAIRAEIGIGDELLWESESVYLRIGARDPVGTAFEPMQADAALLPGGTHERLPVSLGARYARVSGDRNPIHLSTLAARAFGFRRRIAHGMWTKAQALALLPRESLPEQVAVQVDFRAPILLPGAAVFQFAPAADGMRFAVRDPGGARLHLIGCTTSIRSENADAEP